MDISLQGSGGGALHLRREALHFTWVARCTSDGRRYTSRGWRGAPQMGGATLSEESLGRAFGDGVHDVGDVLEDLAVAAVLHLAGPVRLRSRVRAHVQGWLLMWLPSFLAGPECVCVCVCVHAPDARL